MGKKQDNKKLITVIIGVVALIIGTVAIIKIASNRHKPGKGFNGAGKYLNSRVQSRDRANGR